MNFIDHYMKKTNRNFFLLTLGIFMIAIWLSYTNWQLINSLLIGLRQFSAEQLRSMKDPKDWPGGLVNISQAVDEYYSPVMSEFNEASVAGTKIGEKKAAYDFAYVRLEEKYLIVRTEPEVYTGSTLQLVGQLESLSSSTRANFIKYSSITIMNRNLLPFELNTSHDSNYRAWIICLLVGMVAATAIINTYQLIRRIIQPQRLLSKETQNKSSNSWMPS